VIRPEKELLTRFRFPRSIANLHRASFMDDHSLPSLTLEASRMGDEAAENWKRASFAFSRRASREPDPVRSGSAHGSGNACGLRELHHSWEEIASSTCRGSRRVGGSSNESLSADSI
jgi:hypothetical protein